MITLFALEVGFAALLVVIACWVILARDPFTAVVVYVVYGLLLALAWVRLSAVDVALTEAAIGGGLTGMLLLGAAARLRSVEGSDVSGPGVALRLAAGSLCALISAGLAALLLFPPDPPATLAPEAVGNLAPSGLGNAVAGVLFVYRALDTLLEKVVLLLAVVAVWSVAPDRLWGGVPGLRLYASPGSAPDAPPRSPLVFLAQLLPPIGIMMAIYMFWVGASDPGGAFQGGTVLAAMWLLVMIAGLQTVPPTSRIGLRLLMVVGPILLFAIGLAGVVFAGAFLAYPAGYAKPLIVAVEAALTLSLGVTLALLVAGPPERAERRP